MTFRLERYKGNPILKSDKKRKWEAGSVFNPSVIYDKGTFHMVYRAIAAGFRRRPGGGYTNFISSIGYARSKDGVHFQKYPQPLIKPGHKCDRFGCEDPRITKFGDTYYILYTAMSKPPYSKREVPGIALATTKDFKSAHKYGLIGPRPDLVRAKAAAIFPEKINSEIGMLFTWHPDRMDSSILFAKFKNLNQFMHPPKGYWGNVLTSFDESMVIPPPRGSYRGPELGAPPLKTAKGWLLIYCGPSTKKEWIIDAALLDLKNPHRILARSRKPILEPEKSYELKGLESNVTFPEGAVIVDKKLFVYYGAADKSICLATCDVNKLLDSLQTCH